MQITIRNNGQQIGTVNDTATAVGQVMCHLVGEWGVFEIKCIKKQEWDGSYDGAYQGYTLGAFYRFRATLSGNVSRSETTHHGGRRTMTGNFATYYEYTDYDGNKSTYTEWSTGLSETMSEGFIATTHELYPTKIKTETRTVYGTIDIAGGPATGLPFVYTDETIQGYALVVDADGRIVCDG